MYSKLSPSVPSVCFDYQKGIVVCFCNFHCFPCEFVVLYVAVPAGCNFGYTAFEHRQAVGNEYAGVVGFVGYSAYINCYYVSVAVVLLAVGHKPHFKYILVLLFARLQWFESAACVLCITR